MEYSESIPTKEWSHQKIVGLSNARPGDKFHKS